MKNERVNMIDIDRNSSAQEVAHHPRRKILRGAAWSVPVIAVSVAAPAAAASTTVPYDLSIETVLPAFVPGAASTWTWNVCSLGTVDVPAGTTIVVTFSTPKIGASDYATVNLSLGASAATFTSYTPVLAQVINSSQRTASFTITLTAPVPAGTCFSYISNVSWGANFTDARVTATATTSLVDGNMANNTASTPPL